jgi:hypothetical protein
MLVHGKWVYTNTASYDCNNNIILYLIIGCVFEYDLYWSGEVGCVTSITLETGRDDWRGQTKHTVTITVRTVPYVCIVHV